MESFQPAYVKLHEQGELIKRAERAREYLESCVLCARQCQVNRYEKVGSCRTGVKARVASFNPHHGEENPLRGRRGSGTIFFSWCNLRCQYCQNADISQAPAGDEVEPEELAVIMLWLQNAGCHNINFVSPSHVVAQILQALPIAVDNGLRIPLVYNTGGYDSLEALDLLDGVVDIYMPDMKYSDPKVALRMSKIKDYPNVNKIAVREMHRQVGDLVMDERGIAQRGLLVRHLVLPKGLAGSAKIFRFLAEEISKNTYLNIMPQYRPAYRALEYPPFDQPLDGEEYRRAVDLAHSYGLERLDSRIRWPLF
ncbi:MAG: radical SAM protein [Anaerolineales bacterium]|nr:radical SAM protein [Anaerolineales bacterium]